MSKFEVGDRVRFQGTVSGVRDDGRLLVLVDGRAINMLIRPDNIMPLTKGMRIFIFVGLKEGERELGDSVTIEGSALRQRTCAQMAGDLVERLMVEFELGVREDGDSVHRG